MIESQVDKAKPKTYDTYRYPHHMSSDQLGIAKVAAKRPHYAACVPDW